jgi:hypothetical protein
MKFTVVWTPTALNGLATLWNRATDRQEVSESSDRIDAELRIDANQKGVPFGPFRAFYEDPLSVLFAVDEGDCKVYVIQVRRNP